MSKALIKVGYGCNDHCTFCHTLDVRHVDADADEVSRKIRRARALGHGMVVLSGGEPTIRPELVRWAREVAALGMDFGLVTNGRVLAYPEVVADLLAARLRYVYLSLHGGTAAIHNRLVRTDAFAQSYGALANLTGRGLDLKVNCVVTQQNQDHLRAVVDAIRPYPDVTLKFSMVEPKGGGRVLFAPLMPRVADAAARVADAIGYGEAVAGADGPRFAHGGFPLCLLPGLEDRYADLKTDRFWTMIEVGEPDFFPVDDKNKLQPAEACAGCTLRGACPGLYRGYHEVFGAGELRPRTTGLRSNSFNYTLEAAVRPSADGGCPVLRIGVTPWDRGRHLFVGNGDKIARFRADTRDFSDDELAAIKHDAGQVYLDVSTKPAPDDFATDLVKLARSPRCAPCPERAGCTGLFEPVADEVFTRDDAIVRGWLAGLRGDVLDVGCGGGGRYDALLGDLAAAGTIRYVGVEPDPGHAAAIRAARPWAEIRAVALEDLDGDGRYDHVLALRSWNHFADGAAALARLVALARPGGVVTIVDNVAFGLVRTRGQSARAEAGPARFEHHRNDGLGDVDRLAVAAGLTRLDHHDVGPATSNQWAVRYRTPAPA
ncbi:MAG: radical SAM protein [Kofleriaceae bacterium]|nr:radical SAM protein [Kofleriaceae bacterium]